MKKKENQTGSNVDELATENDAKTASCKQFSSETDTMTAKDEVDKTATDAEKTTPEDGANEAEPTVENSEPETGVTNLEVLLAEAEQRGYLRGRNESIEALMKAPGEFEPLRHNSTDNEESVEQQEEIPFLSRTKVSIWNL